MDIKQLVPIGNEFAEEAFHQPSVFFDMGYGYLSFLSMRTGRVILKDELSLLEQRTFKPRTPFENIDTKALFHGENIHADYVLLRREGDFKQGFELHADYFKKAA